MNPQYRIWWIEKDGGRYATEEELGDIYLSPSGGIYLYEKGWNPGDGYSHSNITDQVVVELWTGETDRYCVKVFQKDKVDVFDGNGTFVTQSEIVWENMAWQVKDGGMLCNFSSYDLVVRGTIHIDDELTEGKV